MLNLYRRNRYRRRAEGVRDPSLPSPQHAWQYMLMAYHQLVDRRWERQRAALFRESRKFFRKVGWKRDRDSGIKKDYCDMWLRHSATHKCVVEASCFLICFISGSYRCWGRSEEEAKADVFSCQTKVYLALLEFARDSSAGNGLYSTRIWSKRPAGGRSQTSAWRE